MLHFCSQCFDRCLIYSLCNGVTHSFQERFCFTWEYSVGNPGWHWAPPCWSVQCTVGWSGSNHYACPCLLENQTGRVRKYAENPAAQSEICTNGKRVSECEALRKRHYWSNTKIYWRSKASWHCNLQLIHSMPTMGTCTLSRTPSMKSFSNSFPKCFCYLIYCKNKYCWGTVYLNKMIEIQRTYNSPFCQCSCWHVSGNSEDILLKQELCWHKDTIIRLR